MAFTTIDDPSAHFQTLLYSGNASSSRALTNDGNSDLQPDWVWLKKRNEAIGSGLNLNCGTLPFGKIDISLLFNIFTQLSKIYIIIYYLW